MAAAAYWLPLRAPFNHCSNYCKFEDWVIPIFDAMLEEQQAQGVLWTPSKVRGRVGG